MVKKKIDLSDIKENDLDKTSSFTDLMSRKERKKKKLTNEVNNIDEVKVEKITSREEKHKQKNIDDIEEMVSEKKRNTADLAIELEKAKEEFKKIENDIDENVGKTQILELTRQMKFNFEETKEENNKNKKKGISILNIIGEINLLCIGYYIYLLIFTNYADNKQNYLTTGIIVISLVLLFGISIITKKNVRKVFNVLNVLLIIAFIVFNAYILMN